MQNLDTMSPHCFVQAKLRPLPHERENNLSLQAIRLFLLLIKSHVMSLIEFISHESVSLWECLYTVIFEKLYLYKGKFWQPFLKKRVLVAQGPR